jgi:cobalamin biosynthesis protein CobD/CbiB
MPLSGLGFGLRRLPLVLRVEGILRVLVYYRDPLTRKSQELINRGEIVIFVFIIIAVIVSGIIIAACNIYNRLATLISIILSYYTLSSNCIAFLLKCKVTALILSRYDGRLKLLITPEYFVYFII